jgi:acetyl esterase
MSTDYAVLIDAQTWAFIERTNSFYPPDSTEQSVARQREVYNTMCRAFFTGYPEGVFSADKFISAGDHKIPIRTYDKANSDPAAICLYFHGGGFVVGGLESHDDVCAELCDGTGFRVVSVDYRLAPEHLHPASFLDCLAAFEHVASTCESPIILCGDSAGGNLAAAVTHHVRRHERAPVGQVLVYPGLGGETDQGSYLTHAHAPMLTTRDTLYYAEIRGGGLDWSADSRFAPLNDPDFSGLPNTVVISAECDPLSDDGRNYCEKINATGGKALWNNEPGLVHGYLRARHITTAIRLLGQGRWPGQL